MSCMGTGNETHLWTINIPSLMDSSSLTHKVIQIHSNTLVCASILVTTLAGIMHSPASIPNPNHHSYMPSVNPYPNLNPETKS